MVSIIDEDKKKIMMYRNTDMDYFVSMFYTNWK